MNTLAIWVQRSVEYRTRPPARKDALLRQRILSVAGDILVVSLRFWKALWEIRTPFLTAQPTFVLENTPIIITAEILLDHALSLTGQLFSFVQPR